LIARLDEPKRDYQAPLTARPHEVQKLAKETITGSRTDLIWPNLVVSPPMERHPLDSRRV
jgi:hypothetical protein